MRYRLQNHKNEYTMSGVFNEIVDELRSDLKTLSEPQHVNIATFTRVINLYFKYWFEAIINEKAVMPLLNKFGHLFVVKTKANRYKPTVTYFVEENGKTVRKTEEAQLRDGMFPFMFWDSAKRWRPWKFTPAKKWKKLIYQNFFDLTWDYPEMSLKDGAGRGGSSTYVQKLK